jgi:Flp pilus assembly pilin Flp
MEDTPMTIKKQKNKGQAMMEYIVLVALLAIASIPVIKILGNTFRSNALQSADALLGDGNYNEQDDQWVKDGSDKVQQDMRGFHKSGGGRNAKGD